VLSKQNIGETIRLSSEKKNAIKGNVWIEDAKIVFNKCVNMLIESLFSISVYQVKESEKHEKTSISQ